MTLSIMTLSIMVECSYALPLMLTVVYAVCHYAERQFAECRGSPMLYPLFGQKILDLA